MIEAIGARYLAYCEGGFRDRSFGVAQFVLAKPGNPWVTLATEAASQTRAPV